MPNDSKRINLQEAIENGKRKKETLEAELRKISVKEESLKKQRESINKKLRQLDYYITTTQAALEKDPT